MSPIGTFNLLLKETKKIQQRWPKMRVARSYIGKLCFVPEEWPTAKQIARYVSRLAATQRQQKAPGELLVEEAEAISEENISAFETERQLKELHADSRVPRGRLAASS